MALKSSVNDNDAIVVNADGGASRTYWVKIDMGSFAFETQYREKRESTVKRWVGLSKDAAQNYYDDHIDDSDADTQVGIRFFCDNINIKSYTLERTEESVTIEEVE
jgi:hypothetical protein